MHATTANRNGTPAVPHRIEPLFNDVFLRVFGQEDSKRVTRGLLNSILREVGIEEIGEIERISADETDAGGSVECKSSRYDVRIVSDRRYFALEAQRKPEDIANRSLFYGAKLLTSAVRKGTDYSNLPQAIVVTLLDTEPLFDDGLVARTCQLQWQGGGKATDRMIFVLVELSKVRQRYNELSGEVLSDEMLSWLYLLTAGFEEDTIMETMAEKFPTMEEFAKLYGYAIDDPKTVLRYDLFEESWREERSMQRYLARVRREAGQQAAAEGRERGLAEGRERGLAEGRERGLAEGRERGLAEGREQGIEQGRTALICELLAAGKLSREDAAETLGLDAKALDTLLSKTRE